MAKLRIERSYWTARERRRPRYPACRGEVTVDVAIVGGGITGAAVAWRFAASGVRIAVIEADRVARGSTAASTALLMQEPDKDFHELSRRFGSRAARRIWQLSQAATRNVIRTLERLNIACDLERRASVYYGITPKAVDRLRREFRLRRAAGIAGRWLDTASLCRVAGIQIGAAIRTGGNAQVDPCKACLGLLRAAVRRGAQVFERSRVMRIERDGDGVVVRTKRGAVRAKTVIIATGYATREFKPLVGRFRMMHTYVLATARLRRSVRQRIGLTGVMLWDTGKPYHYVRWTPDGRLLLGGADRPRLPPGRRRPAIVHAGASLRKYFARLYPMLASIEAAFLWEGLFAMTPDGLPYIGAHRRYPNHFFALGYGGNGMTFGFLAARLLLEQYRGIRSSDHDLFAFARTRRRRAARRA